MICDHNGGREFYSADIPSQIRSDVTKQDSPRVSVWDSQTYTPTSSPGHVGEAYSPTAGRSSWFSPALKMSLEPLTNRGLVHSGSMTD